jgi:hypothetical protein
VTWREKGWFGWPAVRVLREREEKAREDTEIPLCDHTLFGAAVARHAAPGPSFPSLLRAALHCTAHWRASSADPAHTLKAQRSGAGSSLPPTPISVVVVAGIPHTHRTTVPFSIRPSLFFSSPIFPALL